MFTEPDSGALDDDTHDPDYVPGPDTKEDEEEDEGEEEDSPSGLTNLLIMTQISRHILVFCDVTFDLIPGS